MFLWSWMEGRGKRSVVGNCAIKVIFEGVGGGFHRWASYRHIGWSYKIQKVWLRGRGHRGWIEFFKRGNLFVCELSWNLRSFEGNNFFEVLLWEKFIEFLEEDFRGYEILFLAFSFFLFFPKNFVKKWVFFSFFSFFRNFQQCNFYDEFFYLRAIYIYIDSRECGKVVSTFLWFCYNFLTHLRLTRFLGKAYEKPPLT